MDTETECLEICVAFHGTHGMQSNLAVAKAFFQSNENIFKGKKWKNPNLGKAQVLVSEYLVDSSNKVQIPTCTVFANAHYDRTPKAEDAITQRKRGQ